MEGYTMMNKKNKTLIALLFLLLLSINSAYAKEPRETQEGTPTTPKATVILQSVGNDFIVVQERTFAVTKNTVIKNKKGNNIPLYRLVAKEKIELEYIFTPESASPVATSIKIKP